VGKCRDELLKASARAHRKREQCLVCDGRAAPNAAEQEQLASGFDEIEIEKLGEGTHERLHRMMDSLLMEVTTFSKS